MGHDKIFLRKCPLLSLHSLNASSYVRTTLRNSYVLFVEQINRAVRQFRYIQTLFMDYKNLEFGNFDHQICCQNESQIE